MRNLCAVVIILLCSISARAQYVSLDNAEIKALKRLINTNADAKKLYLELKKTADNALIEIPKPIDTIHTEGRLKGDPQKTATTESLGDMKKIYSLALASKIEGSKVYLDKAVIYLMMWANANQPGGDPIDDTNLEKLIQGYDLIKDDISSMDKMAIVDWLNRTADAEIKSPKMRPGRKTAVNNWNSHRLKIVGQIGFVLNSASLIQWTNKELKKQIVVNLDPDGSGLDFKERDALHYHSYNLEPLLTLAIVIKRATGEDLYNYVSPKQTSIKKSVEWFVPFVDGSQQHAEYVNTTVKFDLARAKNNEGGHKIGALYNPKSGIYALSLASYFDKKYIKVVQTTLDNPSPYPNWQLVLNSVMK